MERDPLTAQVIGCAIQVHRSLGPGLLESTYERCLVRELGMQGLNFQRQVPVPIHYRGLQLDCGYRIDLLVAESLILELKAIDELHGIHEAQLLTYMKLTGIRTGLLINFNVERLKHGVKRLKL